MPDDTASAVVVGLVGGIAAGKSYIAKALQGMGAELIDADELAHEVVQKPLVARTLIRQFGEVIANERGTVDRKKLAALVFGSSPETAARRKQLEALLHPLIHAEAIHRLRAFRERSVGTPSMVVIDAPLLLEAGWRPMCDAVIFVDASESVRKSRALERGWTEEDFYAREAAQMPAAEKRRESTHVVESHDDRELPSQLLSIWNELIP